jgi:hypothetical protein
MQNRWRATAIATVVVAALLGACGPGPSDERTEPQVETDAARRRPALERIEVFPKSDRRRGFLYATPGNDVLVFGGNVVEDETPEYDPDGIGDSGVGAAADGWIYRDGTEQWSKVELPFSAPPVHPAVVSAGDRAIVVSTPCEENFPTETGETFCAEASTAAAVYSASTGEWSEAARPGGELANPKEIDSPYMVEGIGWTGEQALFRFGAGFHAQRYALYDPEADRWSRLPEVGGAPRDVCIVGDDVIAIGLPRVQPEAIAGSGLFQAVDGPIRTARLTPAGTWEHLPDQELATGANPTEPGMFGCQGGEAFVSRWTEPPARNPLQWFDPATGTWATIPPPPESFRNATPARVGTTRVLFTTGPNYWLLDDGATEWRPVPKPTRVCPGFPENCVVSAPQVHSTDAGLLLIDMDADYQPIGFLRLQPLEYEAEKP